MSPPLVGTNPKPSSLSRSRHANMSPVECRIMKARRSAVAHSAAMARLQPLSPSCLPGSTTTAQRPCDSAASAAARPGRPSSASSVGNSSASSASTCSMSATPSGSSSWASSGREASASPSVFSKPRSLPRLWPMVAWAARHSSKPIHETTPWTWAASSAAFRTAAPPDALSTTSTCRLSIHLYREPEAAISLGASWKFASNTATSKVTLERSNMFVPTCPSRPARSRSRYSTFRKRNSRFTPSRTRVDEMARK
mmetsp:Transcript_21858/g.57028  ORF Transcript_21858/g.57028 Transcript_21858/m.57028 type:complete len:254 (-) Transcript_21858:867-1628(-)